MPASGPSRGWTSGITGPYEASRAAASSLAPAMKTGNPAAERMPVACSIKGRPWNTTQALSVPMRLDRPPARTKPEASRSGSGAAKVNARFTPKDPKTNGGKRTDGKPNTGGSGGTSNRPNSGKNPARKPKPSNAKASAF